MLEVCNITIELKFLVFFLQSLLLVCLSNIKGFNAFDSPFSFFLPINLWWEILYWKDLIEVVVNGFVLKFVFNHFVFLLLLVLFCVTIYLHYCFVVLLFFCLVWFGFLLLLLLFLCISVPSCRCCVMLLLFCCGSPSPIFVVATF